MLTSVAVASCQEWLLARYGDGILSAVLAAAQASPDGELTDQRIIDVVPAVLNADDPAALGRDLWSFCLEADAGYNEVLGSYARTFLEFLDSLNDISLPPCGADPGLDCEPRARFHVQNVTASSLDLHCHGLSSPCTWYGVSHMLYAVARKYYKMELEVAEDETNAALPDVKCFKFKLLPGYVTGFTDTLQASSDEGCGSCYNLDASIFSDLFPFHFLVGSNGNFVQVGDGLRRMHASVGSSAAGFLKITYPCAMSWDKMDSLLLHGNGTRSSTVLLGSSAGLELKGCFYRTQLPNSHRLASPSSNLVGDGILFVGRPRFEDILDVKYHDLYLRELSPYDVFLDTLMMRSTISTLESGHARLEHELQLATREIALLQTSQYLASSKGVSPAVSRNTACLALEFMNRIEAGVQVSYEEMSSVRESIRQELDSIPPMPSAFSELDTDVQESLAGMLGSRAGAPRYLDTVNESSNQVEDKAEDLCGPTPSKWLMSSFPEQNSEGGSGSFASHWEQHSLDFNSDLVDMCDDSTSAAPVPSSRGSDKTGTRTDISSRDFWDRTNKGQLSKTNQCVQSTAPSNLCSQADAPGVSVSLPSNLVLADRSSPESTSIPADLAVMGSTSTESKKLGISSHVKSFFKKNMAFTKKSRGSDMSSSDPRSSGSDRPLGNVSKFLDQIPTGNTQSGPVESVGYSQAGTLESIGTPRMTQPGTSQATEASCSIDTDCGGSNRILTCSSNYDTVVPHVALLSLASRYNSSCHSERSDEHSHPVQPGIKQRQRAHAPMITQSIAGRGFGRGGMDAGRLAGGGHRPLPGMAPKIDALYRMTKSPPEAVTALLAHINDWQFDTFALDAATGGRPLSVLAFALFKRANLLSVFRIEGSKLARFLITMEEGYNDHPYHNRTHAADVLRTIHVIATRGGLIERTTPESIVDVNELLGHSPNSGSSNVQDGFDIATTTANAAQMAGHQSFMLLTLYLAAIVHDYDHRGVNNIFLKRSRDPLALRYNDLSPMENHHVAEAFSVLNQKDINFLSHLSDKVFDTLREYLIELVLSTDMKQHFSTVTAFEKQASLHSTPCRLQSQNLQESLDVSTGFRSLSDSMPTAKTAAPAAAATTAHATPCRLQSQNLHESLDASIGFRSLSDSMSAEKTAAAAATTAHAAYKQRTSQNGVRTGGSWTSAVPIGAPLFSSHQNSTTQRDEAGGSLAANHINQLTQEHAAPDAGPTSTDSLCVLSGRTFSGESGLVASNPSYFLFNQQGTPRSDHSVATTTPLHDSTNAKGSLDTSSRSYRHHISERPTQVKRDNSSRQISGYRNPSGQNSLASAYHPSQASGPNTGNAGLLPLSDEVRMLFWKVAFKCADLGHLTSPPSVHKKWVVRLEEEMFRQGDQERARGYTVSALMNRSKAGITKSQPGFFTVVALPMYTAAVRVLPALQPLLDGLKENKEMWEATDTTTTKNAIS